MPTHPKKTRERRVFLLFMILLFHILNSIFSLYQRHRYYRESVRSESLWRFLKGRCPFELRLAFGTPLFPG